MFARSGILAVSSIVPSLSVFFRSLQLREWWASRYRREALLDTATSSSSATPSLTSSLPSSTSTKLSKSSSLASKSFLTGIRSIRVLTKISSAKCDLALLNQESGQLLWLSLNGFNIAADSLNLKRSLLNIQSFSMMYQPDRISIIPVAVSNDLRPDSESLKPTSTASSTITTDDEDETKSSQHLNRPPFFLLDLNDNDVKAVWQPLTLRLGPSLLGNVTTFLISVFESYSNAQPLLFSNLVSSKENSFVKSWLNNNWIKHVELLFPQGFTMYLIPDQTEERSSRSSLPRVPFLVCVLSVSLNFFCFSSLSPFFPLPS
jgi:hypothetical protein